MKIHILSDLHLDHNPKSFRPTCDDEADTVLVLAGDIIGMTPQCLKTAVAWFTDVVTRYKAVIYVMGNHEFYDTGWEGAHHIRTKLELEISKLELKGKKFFVSEEFDIFNIDDQRFLCGTGWIPEPAKGTPDITDARLIKRYKPEVFRRNKLFKEMLALHCTADDIVVAHHLPSEHSVANCYKGDIYNAWFRDQEIESIILANRPKLYIHGHTHMPFRYRLSTTEIVCNPRGYPNEGCVGDTGLAFNPQLVVEV